MSNKIVSIIRNYRFIIGACSVIMLILLLRSSSNSFELDRVSTTVNKIEPLDDMKALPIQLEPGYIDDHSTDMLNPDVAKAVKEEIEGKNSPTIDYERYINKELCSEDHQYVIMIDGGSTGSRIHIYEFDVCTQPPTLIEETFGKTNPGLSSYGADSIGAAKSLDKLLELAIQTIPKDKISCSPLALKATAGLRLLGEVQSQKILQAVRNHLENDYPFPVVDGDGISIMNGTQEGVFAWITTNYLLGNIGTGEKLPTTGIFDLGGGSTQIVFEPTFNSNEKMVDGEYKYELKFGNENYTLYQFSHLGYGLMQGRNKVNSLLVETAIKNGDIIEGDTSSSHDLISPCLPPNIRAKAEDVTLENGNVYNIVFKGPTTATGAQCRFLCDKILKKDAECSQPPCSFNGVHQPSLVRNFKETNDLYVFSYFYERTQPLGMPLSFTVQELTDLARMVCNGEEVWKSVFNGIEGSLIELSKEPQWCLDLSFQVSLLHTGYDIPLYRELRTGEKIANKELGWCLGAALPLLNSDSWKCKVAQV